MLLVLAGACVLSRAAAEEAGSPEPTLREFARAHDFTFEYRATEIFDEPTAPLLGAPPEAVWFISDEVRASPSTDLVFLTEGLLLDEAPDRQRAEFSWGRRTVSGENQVRLGLSYHWDEEGADGFAASAELSSYAGANLDWILGAQVTCSLEDTWGVRLQGRLDAVLSRSTALRARGWFFRDWETASGAGVAEVQLAQHLGRGAALHALLRASASETGATGNRRAAVGSVELRKELGRTLLRVSYRWYGDSEDVGAAGPSAGVEQEFGRGSLGVNYRYYETDEGLRAGTWWLALRFVM